MGNNILVFAEQREGQFKKAAFECLALARALAGDGGRVHSLLAGAGVSGSAAILIQRGADVVHLADDPKLRLYDCAAYASTLQAIVNSHHPSVVLFPATAMGRDLAPRLAARLGAPLVSDALELSRAQDGTLVARKSMYGGKVFATLRVDGNPPCVATVRPGAHPAFDADASRAGEVVRCEAVSDPLSLRARVAEILQSVGQTVDLAEAEIVVAGGRGLKGPENFGLVRDLAESIGGAVGASRAVVDAGWIDHHHQVGQTGVTVGPKLYIACGISGAIQHLAGMRTSRCIVAINKDPDAPIFKVADYGIVGDLFEVIPIMVEEIRKMRSA